MFELNTIKNKKLKAVAIGLIIAVLGASMFQFLPVNAQSTGELRERSARLQQEINANHREAEELEKKADTLKNTIAGFDLEISKAGKQIELTQLKISTLEKELQKAQKDLDRQKELLRASMRALYKRGDASTVELIVGSDSFSQFMDEQEYLERLKLGIQDSTKKVIELKQQIQAKQTEQKELLEQQEAAKRSLDGKRAERATLLSQTEGEEAKFRSVVAGLQKKRQQVEKQLAARIMSGSYTNLGNVSAGSMIGRVGMTGFTTGPHLHFELRNGSFSPINPSGAGVWPVPGYNGISQNFGCVPNNWYSTPCAGGSLHAGLDISAPIGTPIVAAKSGTIIHRGDQGDGYGIKVIIKHPDGTYTLYAHMSP